MTDKRKREHEQEDEQPRKYQYARLLELERERRELMVALNLPGQVESVLRAMNSVDRACEEYGRDIQLQLSKLMQEAYTSISREAREMADEIKSGDAHVMERMLIHARENPVIDDEAQDEHAWSLVRLQEELKDAPWPHAMPCLEDALRDRSVCVPQPYRIATTVKHTYGPLVSVHGPMACSSRASQFMNMVQENFHIASGMKEFRLRMHMGMLVRLKRAGTLTEDDLRRFEAAPGSLVL